MKKIFIILAGVALGATLFFGLQITNFYSAIYRPATSQNSKLKIKSSEPKTSYNILLLGYGGEGHDGAYLTDTMMIAHVDLKTKKIHIISIPRDIWVDLPTKSTEPFETKINTVYQIELFPKTFPDVVPQNLTRNVMAKVTGLEIDHFITIDFSGFKKALNILDGVDINVSRSFTDKLYPIDGKEDDLCGKQESDLPELEKIATESPELAFPCRYEELHFDTGTQHMDSERALKFVRSRHGDNDGGDFGRAARQQLFLESLKDRVIRLDFITKLSPVLDELKDNITTDLPPEVLNLLIKESGLNAQQYIIKSLVMSDNDYLDFGRSDDGQSILIPKAGKQNWNDVKKWIQNTVTTPLPTVPKS